jgi:hypothetical protein
VFHHYLQSHGSEAALAFMLIPHKSARIYPKQKAAGLLFLVYGMIQISHCPNVDLCTLQNPLLAVAMGIPTDKGTMSIIKLCMLDSLPNIVHRVRRQGNLFS